MPLNKLTRLCSKPINALYFVLDIQVGHSTKAEVAELGKYLSMPNVHL
jgi:hypothetical protein